MREVDATATGLRITRRETLRYPNTTSAAVKAYYFQFSLGKAATGFYISRRKGESITDLTKRAVDQFAHKEQVALINLPTIEIERINDKGQVMKKDKLGWWKVKQ